MEYCVKCHYSIFWDAVCMCVRVCVCVCVCYDINLITMCFSESDVLKLYTTIFCQKMLSQFVITDAVGNSSTDVGQFD